MKPLSSSDISFGATLPWCDPLITAFLAAHSGAADTASRAPVDRLLMSGGAAAHVESGAETDDSAVPEADRQSTGEALGMFEYLGPIGSGGFGTVMLAQSRLRPTHFFAAKTVTHLLDFSQAFRSVCVRAGSTMCGQEPVFAVPDILLSAMESEEDPYLAAFLRETQLAVSLPPHPHIARYDGIVFAPPPRGPSAYLLMELGAGGTFRAFCQRHDARISEDHLVCWLAQLLRGMDHLHAAGVLHRDVKPSNILVRRPDAFPLSAWSSAVELFLGDFGISARADDPHRRAERTVVGTGGYCPPEIARYWGHGTRCPYSCAADLWSLAAVFYVFIACGADRLDDGMSAVMERGAADAEALATATLVRVARGAYPPLSLLNRVALAAPPHAMPSAAPDVTEYGATCDGADPCAPAPGVQRMAQRVQARGLSRELLETLDAMMAPRPEERPTARALLSRSPMFALRLPWWEATAEAIANAVRDGREDPLLDVCNGDSDEEEQERAEEEASVRRAMSPLVSPVENGAFVPHAVVNSWTFDRSSGTAQTDATATPEKVKACITDTGASEGSLIAELIAALTGLTAVPWNSHTNGENGKTNNGGESKTEDPVRSKISSGKGSPVGLYAVQAVCCTERIFTSMQDEIPCDDGPLRHALDSRDLESAYFIHMRLELRAQPLVTAFVLPDPTRAADARPELADADDMTRLAAEALVAAARRWLLRRRRGGGALAVLPWVGWRHDGHCFTVEYIAAPQRPGGSGHVDARRATADVCGVVREWRARLCDLRDALDRAAASMHKKSALCRQRYGQMRHGLRRAADVVNAVDAKMRGAEARAGSVAEWLCVRNIPTAEECLRALDGEVNALAQLAEVWMTESFVLTEGAAVTISLDAVNTAKFI